MWIFTFTAAVARAVAVPSRGAAATADGAPDGDSNNVGNSSRLASAATTSDDEGSITRSFCSNKTAIEVAAGTGGMGACFKQLALEVEDIIVW